MKAATQHEHPNRHRESRLMAFARKGLTLLKFSVSSLVCAAFDLSIFTLITAFLQQPGSSGILAATAISRCVSGTLNFLINKNWCFSSHGEPFAKAARYFCLFIAQMILSGLLVSGLSGLPVPLAILKTAVDGCLFVVSYQIQKKMIFGSLSNRFYRKEDAIHE